MKLEIQKWINNQNFSEEVERLFEESIICYKTEAYRASLLFSYLGFMTIIKERILNSKEPNGFVEQEWRNNYQRRLLNEDEWDKAIFQFTQQKHNNKIIFEVSEEIRHQVEYWKNRRNDCAHAKNQVIKNFHVESFWTFIYVNLPKFVVGGSYQSLINKIDKHFDTYQTPVSIGYSDLVKEIEHSVSLDRLFDFYQETENIIKRHSSVISAEGYKRRHVDFWNEIIQKCNEDIKNKLLFYLKDNDKIEEFIEAYPNRVFDLGLDYAFAKNYWVTKGFIDRRAIKIIISLHRSSLIEEGDIEHLVDRLLSKLYLFETDDEIEQFFDEIGFYSALKARYLNGDTITNFNTGNRIRFHILSLMKKNGIDASLVKTIVGTFNQDYYPYDLSEDLIEFFEVNPVLKSSFIDIARQEGLRGKKHLIMKEND